MYISQGIFQLATGISSGIYLVQDLLCLSSARDTAHSTDENLVSMSLLHVLRKGHLVPRPALDFLEWRVATGRDIEEIDAMFS